ncbi:S9 family peptidase [Aegicerativicinus sediminis]|uniref:S9 family peptidase n=1 Tax=Aegicerativicinus sediminis TaxID=2893202 RepID=UPI001E4D8B93|nr:S9 family peptidase [Aegicerativicinus sediminis]
MKTRILFNLIIAVSLTVLQAQNKIDPTFEEVLSLQSIGDISISPDGKNALISYRSTDWENNQYDTEYYLSKNGSEPYALTNNSEGSSTSANWSPDGHWIAFLSKRGEHNQIHVINSNGGEAFQLSNTDMNINNLQWSPDGKKIAFVQSEDKSKEDKKRKEKYGAFEVDDEEFNQNELWILDFNPAQLITYPLPSQLSDSTFKAERKAVKLIDSTTFTIGSWKWSPDGKKIAFDHRPNPLINSFFDSDISVLDLDSKEIRNLVSNPSFDGFLDWSPDSNSIIYNSHLDNRTSNYYKNSKYFIIPISNSKSKEVAKDFDENIRGVNWTPNGIYGTALNKTNSNIVRIDPKSGEVQTIQIPFARVYDISFSKDGNKVIFEASNDDTLNEVYISELSFKNPKKLTNFNQQLSGWAIANSDLIQWKSKDGSEIEGVLYKPQDYDPSKKYPLMVVIHGGPTGISIPQPVPSSVYPIVQWLNKGALVLSPNYRGSAGYGEAFRSLNVRNLGVGDAWDVLSGVQSLIDEGKVDKDKLGCMGWSQGGYISAFLTTNSNMFKAISVGAGISNWMTYYVNTDIHPFTRQYLEATPWEDKEIYELTSPMTNINNASTPTLIQHGEFDKRVPIANAYELLQGLRDKGVDSKLIVYKGFGHGISKPKERLAAVWHNWQWFSKYVWGEEVSIPE